MSTEATLISNMQVIFNSIVHRLSELYPLSMVVSDIRYVISVDKGSVVFHKDVEDDTIYVFYYTEIELGERFIDIVYNLGDIKHNVEEFEMLLSGELSLEEFLIVLDKKINCMAK